MDKYRFAPDIYDMTSHSSPNILIFTFSLEDLLNLPDNQDAMFCNSIVTDGYTYRVSFSRRRKRSSSPAGVPPAVLELEDCTVRDVRSMFNPCTLDPGRNHVFTSMHGDNEIRRLSEREYYSFGGRLHRQKKMDKKKIRMGIKQIESNIPNAKTDSGAAYQSHVAYILSNIATLFNFYDESTLEDIWLNYLAQQRAIEEACNILINGGLKYNAHRRKTRKSNKNKRRRKNRKNKRRHSPPRRNTTTTAATSNTTLAPTRGTDASASHEQVYRRKLTRSGTFKEAPRNKIPLIIFGDGMHGKDDVHFKGHRRGITDKLYRQFKEREQLGEPCLVDIHEFRTSVVCNKCKTKSNKPLSSTKHKVLKGSNCQTLIWNRYVSACKNMWGIAWYIWTHQCKPEIFTRNQGTAADEDDMDIDSETTANQQQEQ